MGLGTLEMEAMAVEGCAASGSRAAEGTWVSGQGDGPVMGEAFDAFLNPMELKMARKFVGDLAPEDPQEEVHAWHLATSHLLAAQRIGKSRQDGLSQRAEQIEVGLAVRLMTLADRKSASLDRHRAFRLKAADETEQRARARVFRETEAAKRAAEEAEQAEWAAWRKMCSRQRVTDGGQEDEHEQEGLEADGQEGAEVAGNAGAAAAPVLSEAEEAARRAWEQAIEDARPDPRDDAGADGAEVADTAPARSMASGPGSMAGSDPGSEPGTGPGSEPGQAPLSRQQRRALARRAKKEARKAARGTS